MYELFFPGELHARNLNLFDETTRLRLPDLSALPDAKKPAALREMFDKARDAKSPLSAMLYDVALVEEVRIIEEAGR
ncbi:MAG: hypothetical protein HY719_09455 [Planctomycetes bacterium]|nr:hypothetical protein [Planctomycetota bacterium]